MTDQQHITIMMRVRYALWPGGESLAVRISAPYFPDQFLLVDREGRRHELAPYRVGMAGVRRR